MLETKISDLTKAIDALTATLEAQSLSRANIKEATQEQIDAVLGVVSAPKTDPKAEPEIATIDIDALTAMALKASRNGHGDAIKAKLAEIGAPRISRLDAAGLATFADWVEGLEQ